MMSTTKTKGTALITGASAGIGAIYADRRVGWVRRSAPRDVQQALQGCPGPPIQHQESPISRMSTMH
jgi:hypothetical protein